MDSSSFTKTSFCGSEIDNITTNEAKKFILDKLNLLCSIKYNSRYAKVYNEKYSKNLDNPHLFYLKTSGNPYLLFNTEISEGCIIATGVIITNDVAIARGSLVNINSTIGHDVSIGEFTEICPSVNIGGRCNIKKMTFIGTGSTILPDIKIGKNSIIGAGSVVTKDVPDNVLVLGVPARIIKSIDKK